MNIIEKINIYLFDRSEHILNENEINIIETLLRERFIQTFRYMKNEFLIAFGFNLISSFFLFKYVLFQSVNTYLCKPLKYLWVFSICILNFFSIMPKLILYWKIKKLERNTAEILQEQIINLHKSRVYYLNIVLGKSLIYLYLIFILVQSSGQFLNYFLFDKVSIFNSEKFCRLYKYSSLDIDTISLILITGFLLRIIQSYLKFKTIYHTVFDLNRAPLSKAEIQNLQLKIIDQQLLNEFNQNQMNCCIICYEDYKIDDQIKYLKCKGQHHYHKNCIEKWLSQSSKCPYCNTRATI